jgi:putative spermidine/putrescine transport system permease protein
LGTLLWQAVAETEVATALPRTLRALRDWDGMGLPGDPAFESLAADLDAVRLNGAAGMDALARAATRLGADIPALRDILPGTAERIGQTGVTRATAILVADPAWAEAENWAAIRRAAGPASDLHLLATLGLRRDAAGAVADTPQGPSARALLIRSFGTAILATLACLVLAWPLAWLIAAAAPRRAALLAAMVVLPLLAGPAARAAGWWALLGPEGPLAGAAPLAALPVLVQGLLPLMVLPLVFALRRLDPRLPRAAASLGLPPHRVFLRVVLPLTRWGVAAGCALVFVQALGELVVPQLLGGEESALTGTVAAAGRAGAWGSAAALSVPLLAASGLAAALALRFTRRRGLRGT